MQQKCQPKSVKRSNTNSLLLCLNALNKTHLGHYPWITYLKLVSFWIRNRFYPMDHILTCSWLLLYCSLCQNVWNHVIIRCIFTALSASSQAPLRHLTLWRYINFIIIIGSRALSFSGPLLSVSVEFCLFVGLFVCPQIWGQISRKPKVLGEKLLWGAYRKVVRSFWMVTSPMSSRDPMMS